MAAPVKSIRDDGTVPSPDVLIVAEITSKRTATTDRQEKLLGYAEGNVPANLLIDRVRSSGPTLMLYTDPVSGEYQHVVQVPFGEPITLPDPFGLDLDTADSPSTERPPT